MRRSEEGGELAGRGEERRREREEGGRWEREESRQETSLPSSSGINALALRSSKDSSPCPPEGVCIISVMPRHPAKKRKQRTMGGMLPATSTILTGFVEQLACLPSSLLPPSSSRLPGGLPSALLESKKLSWMNLRKANALHCLHQLRAL